MRWQRDLVVGAFALAAITSLPGCTSGHDTSDDSSDTGSQSSGTGSGDSGGTSSAASKLNLITSDATLASAAVQNVNGVTITALVRDDDNNAIASPDVSFSASQGTLVDTTSNQNGTSTVTLYNAPDRANRTIEVTAKDGSLSDSISVPVVGTSIALNGPSSVRAGNNANYTATLTDSAGDPISGTETTITPASAVVPADGVLDTNDNGVVNFAIRTQDVGSRDITVAADGAQTRQTLAVTSNDLQFVDPNAETVTKTAGDPLKLTVRRVDDNGNPVQGAKIRFQTSRGTLDPDKTDRQTDENGRASTVLEASNAGTTIVSASSSDDTEAAQRVKVVAAQPTTLLQSADPTTVAINSTSRITSTVLDRYGNPVSGITVNYNLPDGSAGQLSDAGDTTDANGQATTTYTAPRNSTVSNTKIDGEIGRGNDSLSRQTTLRVAGQPLSIALGSSNQRQTTNNGTTYELPFTALLTDAAGNPVTSGNVAVRLDEIAYQSQNDSDVSCPNEDRDNDGRLESDEDTNHNNRLDPGAVASVPGRVSLDDNGAAQFDVTYLTKYATRVKVRLTVTADVAGSEGSQQTVFVLPGSPSGENPFDVCSN